MPFPSPSSSSSRYLRLCFQSRKNSFQNKHRKKVDELFTFLDDYFFTIFLLMLPHLLLAFFLKGKKTILRTIQKQAELCLQKWWSSFRRKLLSRHFFFFFCWAEKVSLYFLMNFYHELFKTAKCLWIYGVIRHEGV